MRKILAAVPGQVKLRSAEVNLHLLWQVILRGGWPLECCNRVRARMVERVGHIFGLPTRRQRANKRLVKQSSKFSEPSVHS